MRSNEIPVICVQGGQVLEIHRSEVSPQLYKLLDICSSIIYVPTKTAHRVPDMEYTDPTGEAVVDEYREGVMTWFRRAMREWASRKVISIKTQAELSAALLSWEQRHEND